VPVRATGDPSGIRLAERTGLALYRVMSRKGATASLSGRCTRDFGIALPNSPRCVSSGAVTFIWAGPAQWLALSDGDPTLEARLRSSLSGLGAVVDQSDGLTIIRIGGARARD